MDENDVEILSLRTVFQGYFRVDEYRLRHRLYAGGMGPEITREVFERGRVAALLPYDPARDEVVLIEQFRVGALAAARPPWMLETTAGVIEEGEDARAVAIREAAEEAGLAVSDVEPIADYMASQGALTETVRLFVGRVDASDAGGIHGVDDEGEDIKVVVVPFPEVEHMLQEQRVTNATLLISLQWLALNRDALRRRWGSPT